MKCGDFKELISERVAGELSQEKAREFDTHQQICPACRDAMHDWQQIESLLRAEWPSQDPPAPFFVPASEAKGTWLCTVRNWVSAASMTVVAASLLLLVLFRPSIQFAQHQLSVNFGRTASPTGAAPAEAMNQAQMKAMVQAAVQQSMGEQLELPQSVTQRSGNASNDEESRRLAQLGVQLEMVKESQTSLWRQVQQHGFYLQSAWLGSSERIKPGQNPGTNRQ